jgi:hypothetical protein
VTWKNSSARTSKATNSWDHPSKKKTSRTKRSGTFSSVWLSPSKTKTGVVFLTAVNSKRSIRWRWIEKENLWMSSWSLRFGQLLLEKRRSSNSRNDCTSAWSRKSRRSLSGSSRMRLLAMRLRDFAIRSRCRVRSYAPWSDSRRNCKPSTTNYSTCARSRNRRFLSWHRVICQRNLQTKSCK